MVVIMMLIVVVMVKMMVSDENDADENDGDDSQVQGGLFALAGRFGFAAGRGVCRATHILETSETVDDTDRRHERRF